MNLIRGVFVSVGICLTFSLCLYIHFMWWNDFSAYNYYEALGVGKQASKQEIRQAFRKLSVYYHPDKSSSSLNHKRFVRISNAYTTLSHELKRRKYDEELLRTEEQQAKVLYRPPRIPQSFQDIKDWWSFIQQLPIWLLQTAIELISFDSLMLLTVALACLSVLFECIFPTIVGIAKSVFFRNTGSVDSTAQKANYKEAMHVVREKQQAQLLSNARLKVKGSNLLKDRRKLHLLSSSRLQKL